MDELDHNLLDAWSRVFEQCRRDPVEARRRYERMRAGGIYDRPVRAWCVAIRASDTRLTAEGVGNWELGVRGESQDLKQWMSGEPLPRDWGVDDAIGAQAGHKIVLDGRLLRQLGGAVRIPHPGVPIDEAAKLLGKHTEALRNWIPNRPGRTQEKRAEGAKGRTYDNKLEWLEVEPTAAFPLGVHYVPQRVLGRGDRGGGMETPVVWSDVALDPGANKGRPPARWWGSWWQSLADGIPAEFEQVVERVPRFVPYPDGEGKKRDRFRGWWWRCPGLIQGVGHRESGVGARQGDSEPRCVNADDSGCGRLVSTLYAPLPVWTIGKFVGVTEGLKVDGFAGEWQPGVMDRWAGRRSLACERCWQIKRQTFTNSTGWNELVTYLSGGLLYGREVARPSDYVLERKRTYRSRSSAALNGASRFAARVSAGRR